MAATKAQATVHEITATDRLGFTLFISIVLNAVIILGISFDMSDKDPNPTMLPTLDITLVPTRSDKAPDKADFLAQNNQDAGGDVDEVLKPQTTDPAIASTADDSGSPFYIPKLEAQPEPENTNQEILTVAKSDRTVYTKPKDPLKTPETDSPTAVELIDRSKEIAKLSAELSDQMQAYAKRPKRKFISASAKEYKYASYIAEWQRKIEKIGSLNFPDEAKRRNLYGDLLLVVALNANGTIHEINIQRSSGYKLLDDAALHIVRLAAPFSPFPENIRKETDILYISRTWQFLPGGRSALRGVK